MLQIHLSHGKQNTPQHYTGQKDTKVPVGISGSGAPAQGGDGGTRAELLSRS